MADFSKSDLQQSTGYYSGVSSVGSDAKSTGNFWDWLTNADQYLKEFWNNQPGGSPTVVPGSIDGTDNWSGNLEQDDPGPVEPVYISEEQEARMTGNSTAINDANVYGKIQGQSVLDKLKWLIENDPENARSWTEALLGYEAELQNTNDARAYEQYMQNTKVQRTARDLEAAGINPILAYQYLSGTSGSVGTAGYPDTKVSAIAEERASSKRTKSSKDAAIAVSLISAFVAMMAIAARAL